MAVQCLVIDHEKKSLPLFKDALHVKVDCDANVEALKEKFAERPSFKNVDPASLTVWKCMDLNLFEMNIEEVVKKVADIDLESEAKRLDPNQKISTLRLAEQEKLLVQLPPPPIAVWYLLIDYEKKPSFGEACNVEINSDALVEALKEEVKKKESPHLDHISPRMLTVWKCMDPNLFEMDMEEFVKEVADIDFESKAKRLDPRGNISALKLADREILLVQLPPTTVKRPRSPSLNESLEQRHNKQVVLGVSAKAPSSAARPSEKHVQQLKYLIYNGCPDDLRGPPIAIYHPAFAKLKDDLNNPEQTQVSAEELQYMHQLFEKSTAFYLSEQELVKATRVLWQKFFDVVIRMVASEDGVTITNSGVTVDLPHYQRAIISNFEWKQDLGSIGDPAFQGGCSYRKIIVSSVNRKICDSTCCPCLIIAIMGPYFCILGGVFTDIVIVEPFTEWIQLGGKQRGRVLDVARVLKATKNALGCLRDYYLNVPLHDQPDRYAYLPMPVVMDEQLQLPALRYIDRLIQEDKARPLFRAQMGDCEVVVKFPDRYCRDAHEYLASQKLAPELHFCEPIRGGLFMVVMDYVKALHSDDTSSKFPRDVYRDVKHAIELLHERELVFGDLRLPNILLVDRADEGRKGAVLVDFDWCGKEGDAKYPDTLNDTGQIDWAQGVERNGLIAKAHDLYRLERLEEVIN